jgi:hypothetical protein
MGRAMSIKGVLREELDNSLRMQERYEAELAKLPKGSLVKRQIKGHDYYYLVYREDGKVRSVYQGKSDAKEIGRYHAAKGRRAQYRRLLSKVKRQVKFLRGVLRGKEPI